MRYLLIATALFAFGCKSSQQASLDSKLPIKTHIDLTNVTNDKVPVTVDPGKITRDTLFYRMPRVVQGTYAVSDFGRFLDDFSAYDYDGNKMDVLIEGKNTWIIPNAKEFDRLSYRVNDTFDEEGGGEDIPFSPSGTNIQPEVYVLNLHGFVGYFDDQKAAYEIEVKAPANLERTAALSLANVEYTKDSTVRTDQYFAPRYFDVTDNPMFYGDLDVEEFMVGDIKIVLSIYSPTGAHKASDIKASVEKMMAAQKAYLGDINTTNRYDILVYLSGQGPGNPQGFGALEHHTSTVVVLPEYINKEYLEQTMTDVVSHEFFHIVTPLSVHSEDIHYFDYHKPTFSKHLWMYEGLTEYFANHFQIVEGLIDADDFYGRMADKIAVSRETMKDDMSFTVMSENILEEPYKSNYLNVYNKGALIGMCLDIIINNESDGERDLMSLMKELSQKYGQDKPFSDDKIISEITEMTYPSVGEFLQTHVVGGTPINYNEFLNKAGLNLSQGKVETTYLTNGNTIIIGGDQEKGIYFTEEVLNNSFWADQGVQPGDVIKVWNDEQVTLFNANEVIGKAMNWEPGDSVKVELLRGDEQIVIETELVQSYTTGTTIDEMESPTEEQIELRKHWLSR